MTRFLTVLALWVGPLAGAVAQPIESLILGDSTNFYYLNLKPRAERWWPIGVFDSGTGGLTVLDAIVRYDAHHNQTGADGGDGVPDFALEDFIYLADQANMPYGNYSSVGKTDLLLEHILKDAQFLLGEGYYERPNVFKKDKKRVKILVVACNTATAYGKEAIESMLHKGGSDVQVIGVIDAGAKGALATFGRAESGSIGVFATAGTVASGGYVRVLTRLQGELGYTGKIQVFSQGGVGLAEAIDEDLSFLDKKALAPRANYKGPNVQGNKLVIDRALLDVYRFDFSNLQMLCDATNPSDCAQLQINSAPNYVRYHLVSLLETMRATPNAQPMKTLILGCTHYPFVADEIRKTLTELRDYQQDGVYPYRHLLAEEVTLIDPAYNTAQELYDHLRRQKLSNPLGALSHAEFYISVPNPAIPGVQTEADGSRFTYDYKYGRVAGQGLQYTLNTPFSRQNISPDVAERLEKQIPAVYRLIRQFNETSPKTRHLRAEDRL
jgi:glutamate racemase